MDGQKRRPPHTIGTLLRKTSIDELPQLINVMLGDMSLVGPRPERPVFISKFSQTVPNYMARHSVKCGITGWAQVNGWRGNTSLRNAFNSICTTSRIGTPFSTSAFFGSHFGRYSFTGMRIERCFHFRRDEVRMSREGKRRDRINRTS